MANDPKDKPSPKIKKVLTPKQKQFRLIRRICYGVILVLAIVFIQNIATTMINWILPADQRPEGVRFEPDAPLTEAQFEMVAHDLELEYLKPPVQTERHAEFISAWEHVPSYYRPVNLAHIDRFRRAGIRTYEGPSTCLKCHPTIKVADGHGGYHDVNPVDDVVDSVHYKLFASKGFTTYGYNGKKVEGISMGKIDRACPIPGSFAMTAWAMIYKSPVTGKEYSDGCGQCHIGGQPAAPLGMMMPGYAATNAERDAIDCLICHSVDYNMSKKEVIRDPNGRLRWGEDRSLQAAMSVGRPTRDTCARCHAHNQGGDTWIIKQYQGNNPDFNAGQTPRMYHEYAKRGSVFGPTWDVHYDAGINCIDCHIPQGHKIPRGQHGVDLVANDLPDYDVACETCHTAAPHKTNKNIRAYLNAHTSRVSCKTCHIVKLYDTNVYDRDFANTVKDEDTGLYHPVNKQSGNPRDCFVYKWFSGDAMFLAMAIGDHPDGGKRYRAFSITHPQPEFANFDFDTYYENVIRPIANARPSKIYPLKHFDGRMHLDTDNISPFGGMFLPYDIAVYAETGDSEKSARACMEQPIMKMLFDWLFKYYMMDTMMHYLEVPEMKIPWGGKAEPRYVPCSATLTVSHGIVRKGFGCTDCHSADGLLDFKALGYDEKRVDDLVNLAELKNIPELPTRLSYPHGVIPPAPAPATVAAK